MRANTYIEIMLSVIKCEVEWHVSMVDVHIYKLYDILMCYLPQKLCNFNFTIRSGNLQLECSNTRRTSEEQKDQEILPIVDEIENRKKRKTMISRIAVGETPSPSFDCLNFLMAMDPFLFLVLARKTSPYVPSPILPTSSYIWSQAGLWEPPPPRPSPIPAVISWLLLLLSFPTSGSAEVCFRFGRKGAEATWQNYAKAPALFNK